MNTTVNERITTRHRVLYISLAIGLGVAAANICRLMNLE